MTSYHNRAARRDRLRRHFSSLLLALALFLCGAAFDAGAGSGAGIQLASVAEGEERPLLKSRKGGSSWALAYDNDILTPASRDQDYTYGMNLTYSSRQPNRPLALLNRPLAAVDAFFRPEGWADTQLSSHSVEVGLFGFTPESLTVAVANPGDRPYASLVYVSKTREEVDLLQGLAWKTSLTLGVLGLDLVGDLQNGVHSLVDGKSAEGWDHQISDGGEPTARYAIARQQFLGTVFENTEIKSTAQLSLGYLTEASWSLSFRSGHYNSLWSSFNPELASYGEKSTYNSSGSGRREQYVWAGVALKVRAYNAFLQGQFRDSAVTYERADLNSLLLEAWAGYTFAFGDGYRLSYVLRGHSSEVRQGPADRGLLWGGLILSHTLG